MAITKLRTNIANGEAGHAALHNGTNDTVNQVIDRVDTQAVSGTGLSFDSFTTPGVFWIASTTTSDSPASGMAGFLTVIANPQSPAVIQQRFVSNNGGGIYTRSRTTAGAWSTWTSNSYRLPQITSGSVDSLTNPGIYGLSSAVTGLPTGTGASILEVFDIVSTVLVQRVTFSLTGGIAIRRYVSGAWTAWQVFTPA